MCTESFQFGILRTCSTFGCVSNSWKKNIIYRDFYCEFSFKILIQFILTCILSRLSAARFIVIVQEENSSEFLLYVKLRFFSQKHAFYPDFQSSRCSIHMTPNDLCSGKSREKCSGAHTWEELIKYSAKSGDRLNLAVHSAQRIRAHRERRKKHVRDRPIEIHPFQIRTLPAHKSYELNPRVGELS